MKYFIFIFLSIGFFSCKNKSSNSLLISPDNATLIKDSAYSKIYISKDEIKKETIDYLDFDYPLTKEKNSGIIKITKQTISKKDHSNSTTKIKVEPIVFSNKTSSITTYNLVVNADEISYRDASLFAKKNGTDSTEDLYILINPLSGKQLMLCTNDYYDLVIPNSKERRYIGFLSTKREKLNQDEKWINQLGKLYYASNFNQIQEFEINVKEDKLYKTFSLYTPKIVLKSNNPEYSVIDDGRRIALMNKNENNQSIDFSNIQMEITFYYGEEAKELICIIPITNDQLDLKNAFYDRKILDIK